MRGYRPVCEIQFDGFIFPAFDQITTQLAKMHYRSKGRLNLPVVIRVPYGGGIGAVEHHSESPEALFAHTAGLRVISPSSPAEAFTMIQQAIASPDPVLFFEPKGRYWEKGDVDLDAAVDAPHPALDTAKVLRHGHGPHARRVRPHRADRAQGRRDGRRRGHVASRSSTCGPCRRSTPPPSRRPCSRTGRCVVVHEAPVLYGTGAEVAARITEDCFFHLRGARPARRRLPHPVPGGQDRARLPARAGPRPRRRRPLAGLLRRPPCRPSSSSRSRTRARA